MKVSYSLEGKTTTTLPNSNNIHHRKEATKKNDNSDSD